VFQKDAYGADWSKADDLLAYNAKDSDGRYHIYTVKPDGANPAQSGVEPVGQVHGVRRRKI
jgi:hypothetical protein